MKTKYFTGILLERSHGLDVYIVVVRNVKAHTFMSMQAAQQKLAFYRQQLQCEAA